MAALRSGKAAGSLGVQISTCLHDLYCDTGTESVVFMQLVQKY